MAKEGARHLVFNIGGVLAKEEVLDSTEAYAKYHSFHSGDKNARKMNCTDMRGESLRESIKRHEVFLALHQQLKPGMKVLDIGCGIAGSGREIAAFSLTCGLGGKTGIGGASVTGLSNNDTQIARAKALTEKDGLQNLLDYVKADFMKMSTADNAYDAVYTIEAFCHAPDPVACYTEIKRVLKPGQLFAGYEWCLTDTYNPQNNEHKRIKVTNLDFG